MDISFKLKNIEKLKKDSRYFTNLTNNYIQEVRSEFKTKFVELCKEYNMGLRCNGRLVFMQDDDYNNGWVVSEVTEKNIKHFVDIF